MRHTSDEITQNLAERRCWEVARRDNARGMQKAVRRHHFAAHCEAAFHHLSRHCDYFHTDEAGQIAIAETFEVSVRCSSHEELL
jgi:hypothetical protein